MLQVTLMSAQHKNYQNIGEGTNSKILAIIPARGGSKGISRKNIRLLAGKPLIAYSIEAALESKYIDKVVVSTEDDEIADVSRGFGAEVVKRSEELARDDSPTIDAIIYTLNLLKQSGYSPDIVVLLQPTSPLRTSEDIDGAINAFMKERPESLIGVCESEHTPYWAFKIEEGMLKPIFSEEFLKKRRQDIPKSYFPNGAIFISVPENLRRFRSFYCRKTIPYLMPAERSIDIDMEVDLKMAEVLIRPGGNCRE